MLASNVLMKPYMEVIIEADKLTHKDEHKSLDHL